MKSNLLATILILLCLGLGVVLWSQSQKYTDQTKTRDQTIQTLNTNLASSRDEKVRLTYSNEMLRINLSAAQVKASNDLAAERIKLTDASNSLKEWQGVVLSHSNRIVTLETTLIQQAQINSMLKTNLAEVQAGASNDAARIQVTLEAAKANLDKANADAKNSAAAAEAAKKAAEEAIAEKDKEIAALERKNDDLEKRSKDLSDSMTNLQARADAAQKRLDSADGDQQLLMAELKLIQAQKEDLQEIQRCRLPQNTARIGQGEHCHRPPCGNDRARPLRDDWRKRGPNPEHPGAARHPRPQCFPQRGSPPGRQRHHHPSRFHQRPVHQQANRPRAVRPVRDFEIL